MSILKKLAGQSAIYGLSSIVGRFLNYLLVPLHTNIFKQPGEYGVVTEIYAYISFLMILFTYGMETSFFHFSEKEKQQPNRVFSTGMLSLLVSTVLFSGGLMLFSGTISEWLRYPDHSEYIIMMALILGFDALTALPFARLRQQSRARRFAGLKIANILINIFFNLFFFVVLPVWYRNETSSFHGFARLVYNPDTGVGYVFVANLIASVVTWLLMLRDFRFSRREFDPTILKGMLMYALPLLVAGLAGMVNETLDRIMVKYLVTDTGSAMKQLGIYGACYKLSILMTLFIQAFRYAAEPFFFAQFKKEDARKVYALVMKYFVIGCAVIFLAIMMYIDIFKYFIGKNYWPGLKVVPVLLLANLFLGVFFNLSMWYKLTGKTRFGAYFSIFGAILTITFNFLLIPRMGYMGAAWATFICYGSMMVLAYVAGQRHFPIGYEVKRMASYLFAAVALFMLSDLINSWLEPSVSIKLVLNTLFLFSYLFVLSRIERPPNALH